MQNQLTAQFEFNELLATYLSAKTALERARCGNACSPYAPDQTSRPSMEALRLAFFSASTALRKSPCYAGYVASVNTHRVTVRRAYSGRLEALQNAMDALTNAMNALPSFDGSQAFSGATQIRDGLRQLGADMDATPCTLDARNIAQLTRFELGLEHSLVKEEIRDTTEVAA